MNAVHALSPRLMPVVLAVLTASLPAGVRAQSDCRGQLKAPPAVPAGGWPQPLARRIAVDIPEMQLRDALDRIAELAGFRVSYSAELLPLDRPICASYGVSPAGDVLIELLRGSRVEPVVASADHIVLAPIRVRAEDPNEQHRPAVVALDPVYVEASAATRAQSPLPVVVEVIDGRQLAERSAGTLAQALNGTVPGIWLWEQSSSGLIAQYGSTRGASSFGASSPKVYIDGIEVANPLLLTRISPDAIERIEVIRGPQGAALYGADAISGVTNIVTRQPRIDGAAHGTRVRSGLGLTASDFATGTTVAQEHTLGLRTGTAIRSGALNLSFGSVGEFMPGGGTRHWSADGSLRVVGSHSLVTGTLRLLDQRTGTPRSPLLLDEPVDVVAQSTRSTSSSSASPFADRLSLRQYTAGVNATFFPSGKWTHTIVVGVDGFSLGGLSNSELAYGSPADSALRAAGTGALRATLRLSSVASLLKTDAASASMTLSAEHSRLRQERPSESFSPEPESLAAQRGHVSSNNTGLSAQMDAALFDRIFLVGGVRVERDAGSTFLARFATLPMLGGSLLAVDGPVTVKFRTAYGKAIRWPELTPAMNLISWAGARPRLARIADSPEEQAGVEAGVDLGVGRALSIQVTRFDQTASGLVQRVAVPGAQPYGYYGTLPVYEQLQNVGEITNRGWEAQATVQRGSLSIGSTLSLVDSRVQRVAAGYTGDLRAGDRMLAVPARTMSVTGAWSTDTWSTSLTAYRAANWINYDRIALASAFLPGAPSTQPLGSQLREYWHEYDGFTHLRAAATRALNPGLTFMISADNLLDRQVGEPDNITVVPGRTISVGVRASF